MLHNSCKLCTAGELATVCQQPLLVRCMRCGLIFAQRIYDVKDLLTLYAAAYSEDSWYRTHLAEHKKLRAGRKVWIGLGPWLVIRYCLNKGARRIAELGPGVGKVAAYLKRRHITYYGYEPVGHVVKLAREMGLNIVQGGYEALAESGPFDAVLAFEVLEHIQSLLPCFHAIWSSLSEDGFLGVTVPNFGRYLKPPSKPAGAGAPPFHLNFWTKESLYTTLELVGFEPLWCWVRWPYFGGAGVTRSLARCARWLLGDLQGPTIVCVARKRRRDGK